MKSLIFSLLLCLAACDATSKNDLKKISVMFPAISRGDAALVEKELDQGTSPNLYSHDRGYLVSWAVIEGRNEIVRLLISAGADVNARKQEGDGPLSVAVPIGNCVAARLLLAAGADIQERNMTASKKTMPEFQGKSVSEGYFIYKQLNKESWIRQSACWLAFEDDMKRRK
jgi:hypothetical protein